MMRVAKNRSHDESSSIEDDSVVKPSLTSTRLGSRMADAAEAAARAAADELSPPVYSMAVESFDLSSTTE